MPNFAKIKNNLEKIISLHKNELSVTEHQKETRLEKLKKEVEFKKLKNQYQQQEYLRNHEDIQRFSEKHHKELKKLQVLESTIGILEAAQTYATSTQELQEHVALDLLAKFPISQVRNTIFEYKLSPYEEITSFAIQKNYKQAYRYAEKHNLLDKVGFINYFTLLFEDSTTSIDTRDKLEQKVARQLMFEEFNFKKSKSKYYLDIRNNAALLYATAKELIPILFEEYAKYRMSIPHVENETDKDNLASVSELIRGKINYLQTQFFPDGLFFDNGKFYYITDEFKHIDNAVKLKQEFLDREEEHMQEIYTLLTGETTVEGTKQEASKQFCFSSETDIPNDNFWQRFY